MKLKRLKTPEELESLRREVTQDLLKYDPKRRRIEMLENENFQLKLLNRELKKLLVKMNHPVSRHLSLEEEQDEDLSFIYQKGDSLKNVLS